MTINPKSESAQTCGKVPLQWYDRLTISLLPLRRLALCDLALLLQVNMPALRFTSSVFQSEGEDSIGLFDSVFAIRGVRFQRVIDEVESDR